MLKKITVVSLWFFLLTGGVYADKTNANPSFVSGGQDYCVSYVTDDGYASAITVERLAGIKEAKTWDIKLAQNSKVHISADFFSKDEDGIVLEWDGEDGSIIYSVCRFENGLFVPQSPTRKIEGDGALLVHKMSVVEWDELRVRGVSWDREKKQIVYGSAPACPVYRNEKGTIIEYEIGGNGQVNVLRKDLLAGVDLQSETQILVFMRRDDNPTPARIEFEGLSWTRGLLPNSFILLFPGVGEARIIPNDNQMAAVRFPVTAK